MFFPYNEKLYVLFFYYCEVICRERDGLFHAGSKQIVFQPYNIMLSDVESRILYTIRIIITVDRV